MSRLIYIANMRLPTEKAHGLQIVQNCEAFADANWTVSLWAAMRVNTPAMCAVENIYTHYGIKHNFDFMRLPTIDLLPLVPERTHALARFIFYVQLFTFTLSAFIALLPSYADVIYSRDPLVLLAASLIKPRRSLAYEVHQLGVGRFGRWLQRRVVRRVGSVITITAGLRDDLMTYTQETQRDKFLVAHDGVRAARFVDLPTQSAARQQLGWGNDTFVVGYMGRLHTLTHDKGLGTVIDALVHIEEVSLALVGGPDDMAQAHREQWQSLGLPPERFLYVGQVPPEKVPLCLSAFDVCVMPHPNTPHFARHTSPLKLFEYMASGRAIVASDLPGWADVVRDGENVLLVPPEGAQAMADAIIRLRDDVNLRERLGQQARKEVLTQYTWDARASAIFAHIMR